MAMCGAEMRNSFYNQLHSEMIKQPLYNHAEITYNVGMIVKDGGGVRESSPNCQYPTSRERWHN